MAATEGIQVVVESTGKTVVTENSSAAASPRTVQPTVRTSMSSSKESTPVDAEDAAKSHRNNAAISNTKVAVKCEPKDVAMSDINNDVQKEEAIIDVNDLSRAPSDLQRVQRKWQMASIGHFFETFSPVLPLSDVRGDAPLLPITAVSIERAVAEPDADPNLCVLLRDAIATLLLALKRVSKPRAITHWYESLQTLVRVRAHDFPDCFDDTGGSIFRNYTTGLLFIVESSWAARLGTLLALCDVAAEEADCIRDALRDDMRGPAFTDSVAGGGPAVESCISDVHGYRLAPFGRCSQRRFYFLVGKARIFSGFKRKGDGMLEVECSDATSMHALVYRLEKTGHNKDAALASRIRDVYLPALEEYETQERKRKGKLRELETPKLDGRHRKMLRPRRRKVVYTFE